MNEEFTETKRTVDRLIQELEDGTISTEDHAKLMELMRRNARVRKFYRSHMVMAALLRQTAESRAKLGTMPVSQEMLARQTRRAGLTSLVYAMAALVVLGLGFWTYHFNRMQAPEPRWISMDGSQDAEYSISFSGDAERDVATLQVGDRIELKQGLIRFSFPSGVEALVEGPSSLELASNLSVRMDGGLAWFRVPQAGHGFTVDTGGMRVVDLGTEFGVWFDGEKNIQVHVARGKVRVDPVLKAFESVELGAGNAMSFNAFGQGCPVKPKPSLFRREFEYRMPYLHWSFDELVDGGFVADGTFPGTESYQAQLNLADGLEADPQFCQTDGRFGKALSMHGNGFFAETIFPGIGGNAPRTFAAWVRHRRDFTFAGAVTPYCVWGRRDEGRLWKVFFWTKNRRVTLHTSSMGCESFTEVPQEALEKWTHIASVYTGRTLENGFPEILLYIDGVLQSAKNRLKVLPVDTDVSAAIAAPVRFGASVNAGPGDPTVDGDLDEVYLFRGVLNKSQINDLMNTNRVEFLGK
jgi:hypothetical protein